MKTWKYLGDSCPRCGDEAEAYTDSKKGNHFFEDDEVRCCKCGLEGIVYFSEGHGACVSWDEYEEEV